MIDASLIRGACESQARRSAVYRGSVIDASLIRRRCQSPK
jgi:hypothetical protein